MYDDLDCFEKALSHFGTRVVNSGVVGGKL